MNISSQMQKTKVSTLLLLFLITNVAQAKPKVDKSIRYVPAERRMFKLPRPRFPKTHLKKLNWAKVRVGFMIDKKGEPTELVVLESSNPDFDSYAFSYVRKYRYKPALFYGEPRESYMTSVVPFWTYKTPAVLPEFAQSYEEIKSLLDKPSLNTDLVSKKLKTLEEKEKFNFYAIIQINMLKNALAIKMDSTENQIQALEQILMFEGERYFRGGVIDQNSKLSAYKQLFNLYLKKGDYSKAKGAFYSARNLSPEFGEQNKEVFNKIEDISKNDSAFEFELAIPNRGYTTTGLLKRNFSFLDLEGKIETLKLRCDLKFKELPFQLETLYKTPKSWGYCNLQIIGDKGSKVSLIQQ